MKCYRMHTATVSGPATKFDLAAAHLRVVQGLNADPQAYLADAVTIYRGYAVCAEHLEEMEREAESWLDKRLNFVVGE